MDFGVAGDFRLSRTVLAAFRARGHHVHHVTSSLNQLIDRRDTITTYPGITSEDALSLIFQPGYFKAKRTFQAVAEALRKALEQGCDRLVLLHPVLPILAFMTTALLESIPVSMVYYGPMYPSCEIPYLFDTTLLDSEPGEAEDVLDRRRGSKRCRGNHAFFRSLTLFNHLSSGLSSALRAETFAKKLAKTRAVVAWEPAMYVPPTYDLSGSVRGELEVTGALLAEDEVHTPATFRPSSSLRAFYDYVARTGRPFLVVALGSFPMRTNALSSLLRALSLDTGWAVLVHDPSGKHYPDLPTRFGALRPSGSMVMRVTGFVPYAWLLNQLHQPLALMMSGSLVPQQIAAYHQVPLVFYPCLPEQFFWAMAYERTTGVPFLRPADLPDRVDVGSGRHEYVQTHVIPIFMATQTQRTKTYLRQASAALKSLRGPARLVATIEQMRSLKTLKSLNGTR